MSGLVCCLFLFSATLIENTENAPRTMIFRALHVQTRLRDAILFLSHLQLRRKTLILKY